MINTESHMNSGKFMINFPRVFRVYRVFRFALAILFKLRENPNLLKTCTQCHHLKNMPYKMFDTYHGQIGYFKYIHDPENPYH